MIKYYCDGCHEEEGPLQKLKKFSVLYDDPSLAQRAQKRPTERWFCWECMNRVIDEVFNALNRDRTS